MKFFEKILTVIDYVAMTIGFLAILMLFVISVTGAIYEAYKYISRMWFNGSDRWICIAVLISVTWCAARWKRLNSK
jgi:hypothetical protein